MQFFSSLLGLYITGAFVSVVSGESLTVSEDVSRFCKRYDVKRNQRRELQTFFVALDSLHEAVPKPELFTKLSPKLQEQLLMETHREWITALPFFWALTHSMSGVQHGDDELDQGAQLISKIALRMKPGLLIAREKTEPKTLYVVVKGIMIEQYSKRLMRHGQSCGSLSMLLGQKETSSVFKSLSITQYVNLDHAGMEALVQENPARLEQPYKRLKIWARYKLLQIGYRRLVSQQRQAPIDRDESKLFSSTLSTGDSIAARKMYETGGSSRKNVASDDKVEEAEQAEETREVHEQEADAKQTFVI